LLSTSGGNLTHAGGIVRRNDDGTVRVLVVRARRTTDWVFPKGHIEDGESPEETAVREVREEAGVEARPIRDVGVVTFTSPRGEAVRAGYFLMEYVADVPALEDREIRWCSAAEVLELVPFENTHPLIRRAVEPE
jgi:8-oxo-dGTP pyrophosphatase MutT (NUDIX family)